MKHYQIKYTAQWTPSPVSFWVHRPVDAEHWANATQFDPPIPRGVPGKGWPALEVELDGVCLRFASLVELEHVMDVLSRNPLPTTRRLAQVSGTARGPNSHWLSRLPAKAKPKKFRQKLVAYLAGVEPEFRRCCVSV